MQAVDKKIDEEELQEAFIACTRAAAKLGAAEDTICCEAFVAVCERQGMKMRKLISYAQREKSESSSSR